MSETAANAIAAPAPAAAAPTVSLVLGSGGARGYAHIGAIEELVAQGYDIRSVAGASMGALVGGMYAAGKLEEYRDWARALQRLDVLRLLDWTFSGGGFIKGDRVIDQLRKLIGDVRIEDLPISYTAVAVDLYAQREVWFSRGPLYDAIRASIAIPTVFRPHHYEGRTLVDGGLLNPVPITPTLRDLTDCTIAVDINAPAEPLDGSAAEQGTSERHDDATFGSVGEALAAEHGEQAEGGVDVIEAPSPAETSAASRSVRSAAIDAASPTSSTACSKSASANTRSRAIRACSNCSRVRSMPCRKPSRASSSPRSRPT